MLASAATAGHGPRFDPRCQKRGAACVPPAPDREGRYRKECKPPLAATIGGTSFFRLRPNLDRAGSATLPKPRNSFTRKETTLSKTQILTPHNAGCSPPRPLGTHGQALWERIQNEFAIEDAGGMELLAQACAALDRAESCRAEIDRDGPVITGKGGLRDHPLLKHELGNRAFVTRAIARLGLDVEAVKPIGRPPGGGFQG